MEDVVLGEEAMKTARWEDAVEIFSEILEGLVGHGEDPLARELAPVYHRYGESLLQSYIQRSNEVEVQDSSKIISFGEDGEEDDLELAWEALDTARVIYAREQQKQELRAVHVALGDVLMENGNFQGAVEEYTKGLEDQERNRWVAGVFYKMGIAHEMQNQIDEARRCVSTSRQILQEIHDRLNQELKNANGHLEVHEIAELLPELASKLEDLAPDLSASSSLGLDQPNAPNPNSINDVSRLVRRRKDVTRNQ